MAIHLEANYAKKLGLPNFSSHQYSVTIRTELTDLSQVEAESAKLYRMLQDAVDKEIIEVGFMPDATIYGMDNRPRQPSNGNGNGHHPNGNGDVWNCTVGQQSFIKRIVNENNLNKDDVEATAQQLFGVGVKQLDRMQASQLIEELLEKTGKKVQRSRWQTASFIVGSINTKRSVSLKLLNGKSFVDAGNVMIPPNHDIPSAGSVVEVRYLYAFRESGCIYQPIYLGTRDDINPAECLVSQLKYKAEEAVAV